MGQCRFLDVRGEKEMKARLANDCFVEVRREGGKSEWCAGGTALFFPIVFALRGGSGGSGGGAGQRTLLSASVTYYMPPSIGLVLAGGLREPE